MVRAAALRLGRVSTLINPGLLALVAVLVAAVAVRVPVLSGGQIDYDEGVYWQSLRAVAAGHPLFSSVYSSQPPGFLLLLTPAHIVGGGSIVGDRVGVLVFSLAGLIAASRLGDVAGFRWAGLTAVMLLSADPLFLRESVTLQADAPAVALALVALGLAVDSGRRTGRSALLLAAGAGAVFAASVLTKLLTIPALPAIAILLAAPFTLRRALARLGSAVLGAAAASAVLLLPFAGRWPLVWDQVIGLSLHARGQVIGGLDFTTMALEVPLAIVGIAGFLAALRRAPRLALSAASWSVAAILLLAVHRPLWPHHALVLVAPLALLGGAAVHFVQTGPERVRAAAMLLLAVMLASALRVHAEQTPDASRQRAVAALQRLTAPGDFVITDDQYTAALARRDTPPELVDTSKVRVLSGDLTTAELANIADKSHAHVVLVDDRYMSLSLLPGFQEWAREQYQVVKPLGGGRVLYVRRTHRPRAASRETARAERSAGPVERPSPGGRERRARAGPPRR